MSYQRQGTVPADLANESVNRNSDFTKAHPSIKGASISIVPGRKCLGCGWQYDREQTMCPDCGSTSFRDFEENELVSIPLRSQTAHLRRKVEYCWNIKVDPISEDVVRHTLEIVDVPTVNGGNQEFHVEHRCKVCAACYGRSEGRTATPDELLQLEAGKISAPSPKSRMMGTGGAP